MTPEEQKAYMKAYREKNKERLNEYSKQYYEENKEKVKEHQKEHYKQNKEKIKEYFENNKDKIKEHQKAYREKNRERKVAYDKEYRDKNREKINDKNNQRLTERNDVSRKMAFNHRREWTPEEDVILIKLKKQGKPHKEIAETLGRTIGSINIRLVNLRKEDPFNGVPHDDI